MSDLASLKIGQIIMGDQTRDAIHMAIAPVIASHRLYPGQPIALGNDGFAYGPPAVSIGIVDPFLTKVVQEGQKFWVFLNPSSITSLRHDWTHPAFEAVEKAATEPLATMGESEAFCRAVADDIGVDYDDMMRCVAEDDYINMGENENYKDVLDGERYEDFVKHAAVVLGKKPANPYPFSCSC
jgi:hypothetical protein